LNSNNYRMELELPASLQQATSWKLEVKGLKQSDLQVNYPQKFSACSAAPASADTGANRKTTSRLRSALASLPEGPLHRGFAIQTVILEELLHLGAGLARADTLFAVREGVGSDSGDGDVALQLRDIDFVECVLLCMIIEHVIRGGWIGGECGDTFEQ